MSFRTSVLSQIARPRVNNYTPVEVVARVSEVDVPAVETKKSEVVVEPKRSVAELRKIARQARAKNKPQKKKSKPVVEPVEQPVEDEIEEASSSGDEPEVVQKTQTAINDSLQQVDYGKNDENTLLIYDPNLYKYIKDHDTLKNYKIVDEDFKPQDEWIHSLGETIVVIKEVPKDGVITFHSLSMSPMENSAGNKPSSTNEFRNFKAGVNEYNRLVLRDKGIKDSKIGSIKSATGSASQYLKHVVPRAINIMRAKQK